MTRKKDDNSSLKKGYLFSEKIKEMRERQGLTQRELSEKSKVPLDTLRSLENNRITTPGVFIANNLVRALSGSLDEWLMQIEKQAAKK